MAQALSCSHSKGQFCPGAGLTQAPAPTSLPILPVLPKPPPPTIAPAPAGACLTVYETALAANLTTLVAALDRDGLASASMLSAMLLCPYNKFCFNFNKFRVFESQIDQFWWYAQYWHVPSLLTSATSAFPSLVF